MFCTEDQSMTNKSPWEEIFSCVTDWMTCNLPKYFQLGNVAYCRASSCRTCFGATIYDDTKAHIVRIADAKKPARRLAY